MSSAARGESSGSSRATALAEGDQGAARRSSGAGWPALGTVATLAAVSGAGAGTGGPRLADGPVPGDGLTVDRATVGGVPDEGMGRRGHEIRSEERAGHQQADG